MIIAIDAMGGDYAPQAVVDGVKLFVKEDSTTKIKLFGDIDQLKKLIDETEQVQLVPTTQVVEGNDEPVLAIRKKKDSSLVRAAAAVKEGSADGFLSFGNTGAVLSAGIFIVGRIKNVDRPALMVTLPTIVPGRYYNMLDVGANAESKVKYLLQFAQMGTIYTSDLQKIADPSVKLLNIGSEEHKGDELHQQTFQELKTLSDINFQGNIESDQLMSSASNIVVTDGFTGNAVLKNMEGTTKNLLKLLKETLQSGSATTKLGALLVKGSLTKMMHNFSNSQYGAAVLLGVLAPMMKGHGNSKPETVYYAIKQVRDMVAKETITKFKDLYK